MYPFLRLSFHMARARSKPPLAMFETHVSHHLCWPWDLDIWNELNNGRTLSIYDLGRIPFAQRSGLIDTLKRERWGLTIAGVVVRYRRRIRGFDRIEMQSRLLGWDRRFLYIEQSMWKSDGECANHAVYRAALTDKNGIVGTDRVARALGQTDITSPLLPNWVSTWLQAEDGRPWPPDRAT